MVIVGCGNIGQACRDVIYDNEKAFHDMKLVGVVSRDPARAMKSFSHSPVFNFNDEIGWKSLNADVALLCGGSKEDLFGDEEKVREILKDENRVARMAKKGGRDLLALGQGPYFAQHFPVTACTFDDHPRIEQYHDVLDAVARPRKNLAVLSAGWDPGEFSNAAIRFDALLVGGKPQRFYGLTERGGKSMGHTNALLGVPGVKRAIQYTHAIPEIIERARRGEPISDDEKTVTREAILVLKNDTPEERARVESTVRNMKGYFTGYKTTVKFVNDNTFQKEHADAKQHDGVVIATGKTGPYNARYELSCVFESNAHGTAAIMVPTARGAFRLRAEGKIGACLPAEIPDLYRSGHSKRQLLAQRFI